MRELPGLGAVDGGFVGVDMDLRRRWGQAVGRGKEEETGTLVRKCKATRSRSSS